MKASVLYGVTAAVVALVVAWVLDASRTSIDGIDLKGKRVIICGASTGIGRDVAKQYAKAGAQVVLAARSVDKLNSLRDELVATEGVPGEAVHVHPADLGDEQACKRLIEQAAEAMGGIDVLVLNHITYAHYGDWLPVKDKSTVIEQMFRVNTFSYLRLAMDALDHLKASSGSIVVVSSFAGKVGVPRTPVYCGTKHALHGFFDSIRHELVMNKVDVSITMVVLGSIDTEAVSDVKGLIKGVQWAPPDEAARAIIRGGALKRRDVFYPFSQVWLPSVLLRPFFADMLDLILRSTMVMQSAE